ncbi:DUF1499 domain-containing protein [Prochlorococcus sp. MIT 1300]|uniref:DUF1499 domain-containing protein n=1 Tax=Prochlorococcus sp. MIT 1300 TaxID=3096218 RepID=UPI002A75B0BC|nr:DUF1499 domain-containing protein [Prochlorococcus sp. MIT 1300]
MGLGLFSSVIDHSLASVMLARFVRAKKGRITNSLDMTAQRSGLTACMSPLNCVFVQKDFNDVDKAFSELKKIAGNIPRTTVLEDSNNYWKGVCRSLIFRFPDDLEILKVNQEIIQIKSASRIGASDLGVNRGRINYLLKQLEKNTL